MPHVRMLFIENEELSKILGNNKTKIQQIVAEMTGYTVGEIAIIPEMIPRSIAKLSENLLPLEFIIDCGAKTHNVELLVTESIRTKLRSKAGLRKVQFGVWLRSHPYNHFTINSGR